MKRVLPARLLLLVSLACVAAILLPAANKPVRTVRLELELFQGGPADPKQKRLAAPTLLVQEDQTFAFVNGGEVLPPKGFTDRTPIRYGVLVDGKLGSIENGKAPLELFLRVTSHRHGTEFTTRGIQLKTSATLGSEILLQGNTGTPDQKLRARIRVLPGDRDL